MHNEHRAKTWRRAVQLSQHGLAQPLQLPSRYFRPLSGAIQLQVELPMMDGFQRIADALAQERQVEVRIPILRVKRQGAAIVLEGLLQVALLVIEITQIELGERI